MNSQCHPDHVILLWNNELYYFPGTALSHDEVAMLAAVHRVEWNDNMDKTQTEANFRALHPVAERLNESFLDIDWLMENGIDDCIVPLPIGFHDDPRLDVCHDEDHYNEVLDEMAREWYQDQFPSFSEDWDKYRVYTAPERLEGVVFFYRCQVTLWE